MHVVRGASSPAAPAALGLLDLPVLSTQKADAVRCTYGYRSSQRPCPAPSYPRAARGQYRLAAGRGSRVLVVSSEAIQRSSRSEKKSASTLGSSETLPRTALASGREPAKYLIPLAMYSITALGRDSGDTSTMGQSTNAPATSGRGAPSWVSAIAVSEELGGYFRM